MDQPPNAKSAPKRKEQRLRTVLPVRIFGLDSAGKPFTDVAHTLDISPQGARIGGLKHKLAIGDVIGLQRGIEKARFRICWIGAPDTRCQDQAGLQCVQPEKCIWPPDVLALKKQDDYVPPSTPAGGPTLALPHGARGCDRRDSARFNCNFGAEFQAELSPIRLWARCTDLSSGGCYLETRSPLAVGARLKLRIMHKAATFEANCLVRTRHPDFGMGVRFEDVLPDSRATLCELLHELSARQTEVAPTPPPLFNMRAAASPVYDALRYFECEIEFGALPATLSKTILAACQEFRTQLAEFEEQSGAPVPEHASYAAIDPNFRAEITH